MKKSLLFLFAMMLSGTLFSQIVLLSENMESYTVSSFLGLDNPTWFSTWSNLPGSGEDAQILTTYAHSGTKSASSDLTGGQTDCILKLGNKTTGTYELKWWMYIETGKCGYYNIQHFETPGIEWAFELYFRTNGSIQLFAGTSTINGTYPKATWFEVKHIIKLDADSIFLYINGSLLSAWPFHWQNSLTTGTKQLGSVDLFCGEWSGSGEIPGYFFDDVSFSQLGTLPPTVVTMAANGVTTSAATVNGTVNANIQSTAVTFDYGLTTAYGSSISGVPATVTGITATPVSANLTGLLPGATYHYRVHGVNSVGATNGTDMTFTTAPILPTIVTTAATNISSVGATLNGTVDAGGASTNTTFEYGLTTAYGTTVPGAPASVTGNGPTPVIANITGLTLSTTYHYRIKGSNSVGPATGADMTFLTTSCLMPGAPGVISGSSIGCSNTAGNTYSVATISDATGYIWTVPTGSAITAGNNTNSITVTLGTASGSVTVTGTNTCGIGSASSLAVTINTSPVPTISGQNSLCVNSGYYTYTTENGMTSYSWTVSPGGVINYGSGTNAISVSWVGSGSQYVRVNYTNPGGCPAVNPTQYNVTVNPPPANAGAITGNSQVCGGAAGISYSVAAVSGAASYVWALPAGATIASGVGSNAITVNFAGNASGGNITVYANNLCGNGNASPPFPVTVDPLPQNAGTITGLSSICEGTTGVVYTVPSITDATGYVWTVPAGAVIQSGNNTNSIAVDFNQGSISGTITVHGTNSCGNGVASPDYQVTVNAIPPRPVVTNIGTTLHSDANTGNQWYFEGTLIPGANAQTYVATQDGYYWSFVTINGCISDSSNHKLILTTGTESHSSPEVSIFPVPSKGLIKVIMTTAINENVAISIYNSLGTRVYQDANVNFSRRLEKQIDLTPVPDGIYTLVIDNKIGREVRKIVITK